MQVRILKPGDETLLAAAAVAIEDDVPTPERCRALLADPSFVAAVPIDGNQPCGLTYGHVLPQLTRTALLIYSVDTVESRRRRGAATATITALRRLCVERGYYEMWVPTNGANAPAMALYAACGGTRDNPDDVIFAFPTPGFAPEAED